MKKSLLGVLLLLMLASTLSFGNIVLSFTDVKAGEWYMDAVSKLVALGGITGYDDGSFRPSGTITQAEYTAMVARSLGIKAKDITGAHWSAGIMAAAAEAGLVKTGDFTDVTKPITRYEMARITVRAAVYRKETLPADYRDYAPLISDLNKSAAFQEEVTQVVALGIITGYPDKSFQGLKTLTRAEAAVVVMRILNKDSRKVSNKPSLVGQISLGETKPAKELISNLSDLDKFNPNLKTVTLVSNDVIKMTVFSRITGDRSIHVPGHGGVVVAIKDGRSLASFSGVFMAPDYTYFEESRLNGKIESFDYFGFYRMDDGTSIQLVENPWKE